MLHLDDDGGGGGNVDNNDDRVVMVMVIQQAIAQVLPWGYFDGYYGAPQRWALSSSLSLLSMPCHVTRGGAVHLSGAGGGVGLCH